MDNETFLEQYKDDWSKSNIFDIVYGDLVEYCREQNIDEDEFSTQQLQEVTHQIIEEEDF